MCFSVIADLPVNEFNKAQRRRGFNFVTGACFVLFRKIMRVCVRLVAKSEKRPRNHFRGDGMLAAGIHAGWLI